MKPYSKRRGHLITIIFAIMTIIFIILLVLVPVLYVQLSEDFNNQVSRAPVQTLVYNTITHAQCIRDVYQCSLV